MSQPTRARTTGGATRKPRRESSPPASLPAGRGEHEADAPAVSPFAPATLARTLRAVAAELERDPALARRVADAVSTAATEPPASPTEQRQGGERTGGERTGGERTSVPASDADDGAKPKPPRVNRGFRPKLVTGTSPDLGAGIPDPFALYARLGGEGLRTALAELRLGTLRAIAREHGLDPKGTLARQNDAEKLRAAILKAAGKGRK